MQNQPANLCKKMKGLSVRYGMNMQIFKQTEFRIQRLSYATPCALLPASLRLSCDKMCLDFRGGTSFDSPLPHEVMAFTAPISAKRKVTQTLSVYLL